MESSEAVSSGSPPLLPEPPDPDLDLLLPVDPPVPPVPPDPPPILIDTGVLSVQPLLTYHLLAEAALSSLLTTTRAFSILQLIPVSKPRNLVACGENVSFIETSVARFLGLLTAECDLTYLHYSSLQVLEDWTSKDETLAVMGLRYVAPFTLVQPFGVQLSDALSSSQSKAILHLKPWSHMFEPISPCFNLSQGMVFIYCWSKSFLFDHCLRKDFNCLSRRVLFPGKQEMMLFLNGYLPRIEEFIIPSSFRFELPLPQCEDGIWISVCLAMDAIVSGLAFWPCGFASQQPIFWKRCLVDSEFVDVPFPASYVENFQTGSANGTWIMSSTQSAKDVLLQKAHDSTLSSGLSSFQICVDTIVPYFALRLGLVLIEITGFSIVRNLVPLVTSLSCFYNLCKTFYLVVGVLVMGDVPKL